MLSAIAKISILTESDLNLLMSCIEGRNLKKDEVLLKEGEVCRAFYLVNEGYLRTYYNKDGDAINLNFSFEGSFTTNLKSYKNREPSTFTIEAGEDTSVWVLNLKVISSTINNYPEVSKFIRRLAINMLLDADDHSNLFKIHTPTERYRYIETHKPELIQRVPLLQLASYLGVARETLSRIRAKHH